MYHLRCLRYNPQKGPRVHRFDFAYATQGTRSRPVLQPNPRNTIRPQNTENLNPDWRRSTCRVVEILSRGGLEGGVCAADIENGFVVVGALTAHDIQHDSACHRCQSIVSHSHSDAPRRRRRRRRPASSAAISHGVFHYAIRLQAFWDSTHVRSTSQPTCVFGVGLGGARGPCVAGDTA